MELINAGGGAAAAGAATQEFWAPVTYSARMGYKGVFPTGYLINAYEYAYISFHVPHDFTSITEAYAVIIPLVSSGGIDIDIYAKYGAAGESYQAHTETDTASTYSVSTDVLKEIDISGILTSIAVGDYVGIGVAAGNAAADLHVLGVRFKYS